MAPMLLKNISLLFLLISASFVSTSLAGRGSLLVNKSAKQVGAAYDEEILREVESVHERLLRVNTKDYGNYDPAPALVKPPFKLIPN